MRTSTATLLVAIFAVFVAWFLGWAVGLVFPDFQVPATFFAAVGIYSTVIDHLTK